MAVRSALKAVLLLAQYRGLDKDWNSSLFLQDVKAALQTIDATLASRP